MKPLYSLLLLAAATAMPGMAAERVSFNIGERIANPVAVSLPATNVAERPAVGAMTDYPELPEIMTQLYTYKEATTGCPIRIEDQGFGTVHLEGFAGFYSDFNDPDYDIYKPIIGTWDVLADGESIGITLATGQLLFSEERDGVTYEFRFYWFNFENSARLSEGSMALIYNDGTFTCPKMDMSDSELADLPFYPTILVEVAKSTNPTIQAGTFYYLNDKMTDQYTIVTPNSTVTYDLWKPDINGQWVETELSPVTLPVYIAPLTDKEGFALASLDPTFPIRVITVGVEPKEKWAYIDNAFAINYTSKDFYVEAYDFENATHNTFLETDKVSEDGKTVEFGPWCIGSEFTQTGIKNYITLRGCSHYLKIEVDKLAGIDNIAVADEADEAPAVWYTLQGVRLAGEPQQPGMYVSRGRKMIVK